MEPPRRDHDPGQAGAYQGYPRAAARPRRPPRLVVVVVVAVELVTLVAGCLARPSLAAVPLRLDWAFSAASHAVTIRVTSPAGQAGQRVLAQSRLAVSEHAGGHTGRWSAGGGTVQVPMPAGGRISLLVQLTGPQPLTRTVTVTAPPPGHLHHHR